jgi:hypothetical protein
MSRDCGFASYRSVLEVRFCLSLTFMILIVLTLKQQSIVPPCVPYVGVYLTDLTFFDEGNRDTKNDLINFNKRLNVFIHFRILLISVSHILNPFYFFYSTGFFSFFCNYEMAGVIQGIRLYQASKYHIKPPKVNNDFFYSPNSSFYILSRIITYCLSFIMCHWVKMRFQFRFQKVFSNYSLILL